MAEAFLSQLLTTENRVDSKDDAHCFVCLQTYGTLTDTGAIECEIHLPCNHRLGSMCAFTWLKSHNTCPICRHAFFPAQPRPYLEHGIMGHITPNPPVTARAPEILDDNEGIQEILSEIVRHCCSTPDWDDEGLIEALRIAEPMAEALRQRVQADGFCLDSIAGATVYIVSHLLGHPRSSLEISRVLYLAEHRIRSLYNHIYADRESLIDPSMLEELGRGHMEEVLAFLPSPDSNEEVIGNEYEPSSYSVNARFLGSLCGRFCHQLGHRGSVVHLVQQMAEAIRGGSYPGVHLHITISAVSIYMAFHLMGIDTSYGEIQHLTGVAARTIQDSYHRLYPQRNHLIDSRSLEYIGRHDRSRILGTLILLSWPPLHPETNDDPGRNNSQSEDHPEVNDVLGRNDSQSEDQSGMTDSLTQDNDVSQIYRRECERFCTSLGLSAQATEISYRIAVRINSEDRVEVSSLSIVAVSIYIATRIMGRLASYDEISTVVKLPADVIRASFSFLVIVVTKHHRNKWICKHVIGSS